MGWGYGMMWNKAGMRAAAARLVGHFSTGIAFAQRIILWFSPRRFSETVDLGREVSMTYGCRQAKRLVVLVVGATVLLLGLVLLFLPGPGLITIVLGLSILASECVWARQILERLRERLSFFRMLLRRPFRSPRDGTSKPRLIQGLQRFRATFRRR